MSSFKSQSVAQITDASGDALEVTDPQIGKHFTKLPNDDNVVKTTVANFWDLREQRVLTDGVFPNWPFLTADILILSKQEKHRCVE